MALVVSQEPLNGLLRLPLLGVLVALLYALLHVAWLSQKIVFRVSDCFLAFPLALFLSQVHSVPLTLLAPLVRPQLRVDWLNLIYLHKTLPSFRWSKLDPLLCQTLRVPTDLPS